MTAYLAHADDTSGGPNGGQQTVGSTPVVWTITTPHPPSSGDKTTDHVVHGLSLSLKDPSAVMELVYGRAEISALVGGSGGAFYRGNGKAETIPTIGTADLSFHEVLGRYFLSGGQPLQLKFEEPIEALSNAESNTDNAFIVWLKRVDSESAVGYHLNVDYEVRYGY